MRWLLLLAFIVAGVLFRWLPHPPNFTPLLAMALFAGAHIQHRGLALAVPLLAIGLSDLWLGTYPGMWAVYLGYALIVVSGFWWFKGSAGLGSWGHRAALLTLAPFIFFFVSNLGVWANGLLYPRTAEGLWLCYVMAVPFFPATLYSTWVYGLVLFGGWSLLEKLQPQWLEVQALSVRVKN